MSLAKGAAAEQQALDFLLKQGLDLVAKNYRAKCGEIDLIVKDNDCLVFVEVRYRHHQQFGGPLASITQAKVAKLVRTAKHYLVSHQIYDKMPCRFDVVAIGQQGNVEWIKNAFSA